VAWFWLVVAGLCEIGWASLLPATRSFTRGWPTLGLIVLLAGSMGGLGMAVRSLPLGTAYAVWVGIGAIGAVLLGVLVYGDPLSAGRALFLTLLVVSIVGLEVTGSSHG
jgi:quaternary ammonium compound-resistance protein SugE